MKSREFFIFFFMMAWAFSCFASLSATLDRSRVYLGESFQLSIHAGEQDEHAVPDMNEVIKKFDILSSGKNTEVLVSQGKSISDTLWVFVLSPRQAGKQEIPPITIGHDKTPPLAIMVEGASPTASSKTNDRHVFMETEIFPVSPYVQSRSLYRLIIYYDKQIENPQLTVPTADETTFIHLGGDKYNDKKIQGKLYHVLEVNFAMFPRKSGHLIIHSPVFSGNVMNDSVGEYFSNLWQPFRLSCPDKNINVKPVPAIANAHWWLPSKNIILKEEWSSSLDKLKPGEPITRTIFLKGEDVLANQLPEIMPKTLSGFQIYPDKPVLNTTTDGKKLYASRLEKAAFIALKSGDYTLPAISVFWWNTEKNQLLVATIPERHIRVGAAPLASETAAPGTMVTTTPGVKKRQLLWDPWFWLSNLFLAGWMVTVYFSRKQNQKDDIEKSELKVEYARKKVKQAILDAIQKNDLAAFQKALLQLAQLTWPSLSFLSLGDIGEVVTAQEGKDLLIKLDKALYGDKSENINLTDFYLQIKKYLKPVKEKNNKKDIKLPDFYP